MDTSTNAMKSMRLYDRVERLLKELEAAGFAADQPLTVDDLAPFDHLHYCGTTAVDRAIRDCRIATGDNVVEIGSGVGGPARWIAAKTGAAVTALELQPDLDALATTLTARTGLDGRVRHLCANILDDAPAGAPFDHAVSFLCFLHIPDRREACRDDREQPAAVGDVQEAKKGNGVIEGCARRRTVENVGAEMAHPAVKPGAGGERRRERVEVGLELSAVTAAPVLAAIQRAGPPTPEPISTRLSPVAMRQSRMARSTAVVPQ